MRALHICQSDNPNSGAPQVAFEIVKRLPHYGVDAHCVYLYGDEGFFGTQLNGRAHYLNIPNSKHLFKLGRLNSIINNLQPDIIHHHDELLWPHLATSFYSHRIKISHVHTPVTQAPIFSKTHFASIVEGVSTNLFICVSSESEKNLRFYNKRIHDTAVVYNGIDRQKFFPASMQNKIESRKEFHIPNDVMVAGFVGRLECRTKGADDFIEMIKNLPENYWGLMVGGGSDESYLKAKAEKLNLSKRIIFTGVLNNPSKAYHAMDCFCLTSHRESFGLVVGEAMACDLPIVAFSYKDACGELLNPETIDLISDRNLSAMAQRIVDIFKDPDATSGKIKTRRALLEEKFNWDKSVQKLAQIYQRLTQSKN